MLLHDVLQNSDKQLLNISYFEQKKKQYGSHISSTLINVFSNISKKVVPVCIYC